MREPHPGAGFRVSRVPVRAHDGFPLGATLFEPEDAHPGTVLVHGATAVRQDYYRPFAEFLAQRGHRVLTYDYRGVGLSRVGDLRGFEANLTDWGTLDATAMQAHVRAIAPGEPTVWVGHSFGGQLLGLVDLEEEVTGALLVGAQFGYQGHFGPFARLGLATLFGVVVPTVTRTVGYLPGELGLGTDLPRGVAEEWARWCRTPGYLTAYHEEATHRLAELDVPVVCYSFTDDGYAPLRAVDALVSMMSPSRVAHRRIDPASIGEKHVGHFGFFRPRMASTLWVEGLDVLEDLLAGRPPEPGAEDFWGMHDEDVRLDLAFGRS